MKETQHLQNTILMWWNDGVSITTNTAWYGRRIEIEGYVCVIGMFDCQYHIYIKERYGT